MGDFDDDDDVLNEAGALIARREEQRAVAELAAHLRSAGVAPAQSTRVAKSLVALGWHRSEVEYSVRFDRSGYVESRHTSRESAQWSLEKLREEGVPCSLVKRLRAGEWVDA